MTATTDEEKDSLARIRKWAMDAALSAQDMSSREAVAALAVLVESGLRAFEGDSDESLFRFAETLFLLRYEVRDCTTSTPANPTSPWANGGHG
jgi:hypothetical protein